MRVRQGNPSPYAWDTPWRGTFTAEDGCTWRLLSDLRLSGSFRLYPAVKPLRLLGRPPSYLAFSSLDVPGANWLGFKVSRPEDGKPLNEQAAARLPAIGYGLDLTHAIWQAEKDLAALLREHSAQEARWQEAGRAIHDRMAALTAANLDEEAGRLLGDS